MEIVLIDDLNPIAPSRTLKLVAGNASANGSLTIGQVLDLLVDAAPGTLDTLNELAAAIGDDPNFSATVLDALSKRLRFDAAQSLTATQQNQILANIGATVAVPDHVRDLIMSNNVADAANDIDISAGSAKGNGRFIARSSAIGKRLDATWAAGGTPAAAVGGLDTGAKANGATYTCFAVQKDSDGSGDFVFSLSPNAPTMTLLAGYTVLRPVGRVMVDASGVNRPFIQSGNNFFFNAPYASLPTDITVSATRAKALMTCNLPNGVRTMGYFAHNLVANSGDSEVTITYADGINPNIEQPFAIYVSASVKRSQAIAAVYSNASAQINLTQSQSTAGATTTIKTLGWNDYQIPRI